MQEILCLNQFISDIWKLATNARFQPNISKLMPHRLKATLGHRCEYH